METILIADDDPIQRRMLTMLLEKRLGYAVQEAENGKAAVQALHAAVPDTFSAAILDLNMPVMDGFEALKVIRKHHPDLPVLMLTAKDDAAVAVRAIKEGAFDFIVKPMDATHLEVTLKNALRMQSVTRELLRLKRDKEGALCFSDIIGHDAGLSPAASFGRKAALSDVPVLISGETGVGKELFARAIHGESKRVGAPFVAINCGAIPENLVESILFGHEKGSFTGAITRTLGKFREADGGTLFLDEIGDLSADLQVKLLRVLQQKEVEPVGGGKPVKVDVRILSATHRDLKHEVTEKRFREDLYFRLNVLPIHVPALRERGEDVVTLAEYFIRRFSDVDGLAIKTLREDAKQYLRRCVWPGNVRELENLIRRALVLTDGDQITLASLEHIHEVAAGGIASLSENTASPLSLSLLHADGKIKTMEEIEQESMQRVLQHYNQNITRASESLGMAKSTFYRKLKEV